MRNLALGSNERYAGIREMRGDLLYGDRKASHLRVAMGKQMGAGPSRRERNGFKQRGKDGIKLRCPKTMLRRLKLRHKAVITARNHGAEGDGVNASTRWRASFMAAAAFLLKRAVVSAKMKKLTRAA